MGKKRITAAVAFATLAFGAAAEVALDAPDFRLVVGDDAIVKSLVVKATGEECIAPAQAVPLFTVTQDRPFNNELKLIHPNKRTVYPACALRREGGRLIASFPHRQYEAVVSLRQGAGYLAFTLDDFICDRKSTYDYLKMDIPPVASFRLLQLPVRPRRNFGDWLNACWDERAAVAVVGASPHADIDHEDRPGAKMLFGEAYAGIRLRGCAVALIAAPGREAFLDAMDAFERDYALPRGVASRRSQAVREFIFHLSGAVPLDGIDEAIAYARKGGFRLMTFGQHHVTDELPSWGREGDYVWRADNPAGAEGLRAALAKVKAAGISPGLHTFHSHIGLKSRYVTPVADPRLNKKRRFTLAEPLPAGTNDLASVAVYEPTADVPMFPACRILQFGGELMSYESYTSEPPYRFRGVRRGAHATRPAAHPKGEIGGILDVSEFGSPMSCYIDQNTDLQDEVAARLAEIYSCGFEYIYLDGSEGVNRPFNFHVANAQLRLWRRLCPEPLFAEAAAKTHFGWHMLAGANAFDCFPPAVFKEKLRQFPFAQAPVTAQDMTRVDFGWWNLTKDVQPDMWEYGASVAVAWDCAASCLMTLSMLRSHPRAADILETMRRWSDVRRRGLFREEWRAMLKDYSQEHHLLLLADGGYDLVPYSQMPVGSATDGGAAAPVRAFVFVHGGVTWAVYWHCTGEGRLSLPIAAGDVALFDEFAGRPVAFASEPGRAVLPAGPRRYLRTTLTPAAVRAAFAAAQTM